MSGAVCPACGVPVVPGYVRCPKCHAPLPSVRFRRPGNTIDPGGTAVPGSTSRSSMILVLLAGIAGVAIVAYLGLRGGTKTKPAVRQEVESGSSVSPAVALETTAEITPAGSAAAAAPNPGALASKLEGTLRKQRLWSTVEVVGDHADVRSGSCNDPAMLAALATAATSFKAAGLTKLRCLEQSGHVVLARDL